MSRKKRDGGWLSSDGVNVPSPDEAKAMQFQKDVLAVLGSIEEMLVEKNRKYGNAALEPVRIFSKQNSIEQLKVRIDDKLSRLRNEQTDEDEDVVKDLIGYLVLYSIAKGGAR